MVSSISPVRFSCGCRTRGLLAGPEHRPLPPPLLAAGLFDFLLFLLCSRCSSSLSSTKSSIFHSSPSFLSFSSHSAPPFFRAEYLRRPHGLGSTRTRGSSL
ncbi:hypothetical protein AOLI_G00186840 [Acnodon oligacanthus]